MKQAFWSQGGLMISLAAFVFSLINFFFFFSVLFDYADRSIPIPGYVGAGVIFAIPASLLLLAATGVLCRLRERAPALLTATLALLLLCGYDAVSVATFARVPVGDRLPISTVRSAHLEETARDMDGLLYLGLLEDRELYDLHGDLDAAARRRGLTLETAVLEEQMDHLSPALRDTLDGMGVVWLPAVVVLEEGTPVQTFNGATGLWEWLY